MPKPLYEPKSGSPLSVDPLVYGPIASETESRTLSAEFVVPIRSGYSWTMKAGQVCRLVLVEGPQVFDLNWGPNAVDPLEVCRPLGVEAYDVKPSLLERWQTPRISDYSDMHGLRSS